VCEYKARNRGSAAQRFFVFFFCSKFLIKFLFSGWMCVCVCCAVCVCVCVCLSFTRVYGVTETTDLQACVCLVLLVEDFSTSKSLRVYRIVSPLKQTLYKTWGPLMISKYIFFSSVRLVTVRNSITRA